VAQDTPLYKSLPVADMIYLTRRLNRRFDQRYARARLDELGIPLTRRAGKLSGGQQAQLALTMALARRPYLLVLDEPVAMLDPVARHDFMATVLAADDAVFTADVGTPCIWAARYLRMNGRRRLIGSFNHGSMANALPQAIGAQASQPGRQVVALSGDGGIAMLLGELITLRQLHLPVKVVVFNNGALSFVELEMKAAGIVTYGTDLDNPDFAAIARAAGLFGARVEKAGELDDALLAAFEHDGPALVDVRTDRHELALPPKLSYGEIKGFSLYATRTILSGEGEELIDLAKSNLRDLDIE
jgi:hypothetical protein